MDRGEPVAERREPLPREPQRLGIAVEPDDLRELAPGEDGLAVPAEPQRGVHEDGALVVQPRVQEGDDPVEEHRGVGRRGHRSA